MFIKNIIIIAFFIPDDIFFAPGRGREICRSLSRDQRRKPSQGLWSHLSIMFMIRIMIMIILTMTMMIFLLQLMRLSPDRKIGDMYLYLQTVKEPVGNSEKNWWHGESIGGSRFKPIHVSHKPRLMASPTERQHLWTHGQAPKIDPRRK